MKKAFAIALFTTVLSHQSASADSSVVYERSGASRTMRLSMSCEDSKKYPRFHTGDTKEVFLVSKKKLSVGAPICKDLKSKSRQLMCDCRCEEGEVPVALRSDIGLPLLTCMQFRE
jgi:hypothetical protein